MLSLSQLSPSVVTAVVMTDWLGTGAAEQIWRSTWAHGGYDLRQVISR
uniref:Uncharacterized protein n=1 Tax=Fagus sylvatica TaxID=28930 RepID=A0A2N9F069_FAGSY